MVVIVADTTTSTITLRNETTPIALLYRRRSTVPHRRTWPGPRLDPRHPERAGALHDRRHRDLDHHEHDDAGDLDRHHDWHRHQPRARPLNSYIRNLRISGDRLISLDAYRRDSEHVPSRRNRLEHR
jgi:hypothetical protein